MSVSAEDNKKIDELVSRIEKLMQQIENTPSLPEHKLILVDRLEDCFDCLEEFDVFKGCMSLRLLRERIGVVRKDLEMCVVPGDRS